MPLDAKNFDLVVYEGWMGWGGCAGWDLLRNFLVSRWVNFQIEDFNIFEHDPRMLKTLNSRFLNQKTSN